ncbi:hypothetical protein ACQ4PT_018858 [Festuca glaucescens]
MALSGISSAATRPEEDTVIIATSFELDQEMKDWEATAAIGWVVNGNRKIEAKAIDRAIRKEFRLSHRDLNVCPHQPVQFLLKFEHKAHCTEVLKRGRIKADNALLQLRPWRPLEHAFGAAMSFRVRLCLEGVPAYGLTPYVAERIISRRCSFDRLDDSSALLTSARSLDCWAWTANPSSIPKVVWLTFTSRGAGGLASEVFVHEVRPTGSKRGATFRIIVHLDKMEDYSTAPLDFFGSSTDAAAFRPTPVSFDWHYLTVDGMPPTPMQNEGDDEVLARAAALARRGRGGPRDDHPRVHPRRDDRDDDQDRDGAALRDRRSLGARWGADGSTRRERTRSPRRRDGGHGSHGRRHDADIDMADAPPAASPTSKAADSADLRAYIVEQGALLRAELMACLKDTAAPILAESAALRAWQGRALSFLDKACGPQPPPQPPQQLPMINNNTGSLDINTRSIEEDASLADPTPLFEDAAILGQLELLHLSSPAQGIDGDGLGSASLGLATSNNSPLHASPGQGNEAWDAAAHSPDSQEPASPLLSTLPNQPNPGQRSTSTPPRHDQDRSLVAQDSVHDADAAAPLQEFLVKVTSPVLQPLLGTPALRQKKKKATTVGSPRRSGRIAIKKKARQLSEGSIAIQELIAKVCGIFAPAASFDKASAIAYQQMFLKAPLAATAIQALEALVKQVKKVKKKTPAIPLAKPVVTGADD